MSIERGIVGIITTRKQVSEFEKVGFSREEMKDLNIDAVRVRRLARENPVLGVLAEQHIALTLNNALLEKSIQCSRFLRAAREIGEMITRTG